MTILQISWCDPERDIRCNFAGAFDGIIERFSAPMAEYVFVDSMEDAQALKQRLMENVPAGREPYMQALMSCAGTAREHYSAILAQRHV
jgi:hypothetical protein